MTVIQHIRPSEHTHITNITTRPQFEYDDTDNLELHLKQCHRRHHVDVVVHGFNVAHGFMATRIITSVMCMSILAFALFWLIS